MENFSLISLQRTPLHNIVCFLFFLAFIYADDCWYTCFYIDMQQRRNENNNKTEGLWKHLVAFLHVAVSVCVGLALMVDVHIYIWLWTFLASIFVPIVYEKTFSEDFVFEKNRFIPNGEVTTVINDFRRLYVHGVNDDVPSRCRHSRSDRSETFFFGNEKSASIRKKRVFTRALHDVDGENIKSPFPYFYDLLKIHRWQDKGICHDHVFAAHSSAPVVMSWHEQLCANTIVRPKHDVRRFRKHFSLDNRTCFERLLLLGKQFRRREIATQKFRQKKKRSCSDHFQLIKIIVHEESRV